MIGWRRAECLYLTREEEETAAKQVEVSNFIEMLLCKSNYPCEAATVKNQHLNVSFCFRKAQSYAVLESNTFEVSRQGVVHIGYYYSEHKGAKKFWSLEWVSVLQVDPRMNTINSESSTRWQSKFGRQRRVIKAANWTGAQAFLGCHHWMQDRWDGLERPCHGLVDDKRSLSGLIWLK